MQACKDKGLTASEVIRDFVEAYPVKPRRRVWPTLTMPNKEPVMSFSLVAVLSASLAASTFLPTQSAIGDRRDPEAAFAQIDTDGDNRFDLTAMYELAGLTAQGELSQEMIKEITDTVQAAMIENSALIQEEVLSIDFERLLAQSLESAQASAATSVQGVFNEMDANSDAWVTRSEFMRYARS